MKANEIVEELKRRFPNEPEYIQAVSQVLPTIEEEYNKHPEFEKANLIERLCIPDRIYQFRVLNKNFQSNEHHLNLQQNDHKNLCFSLVIL